MGEEIKELKNHRSWYDSVSSLVPDDTLPLPKLSLSENSSISSDDEHVWDNPLEDTSGSSDPESPVNSNCRDDSQSPGNQANGPAFTAIPCPRKQYKIDEHESSLF